jgi:UDP-N-acetylmuramyl pentapeptide phosphotransferase/UDP-N-acetylglucosamine-1-phosphate transferase
MHALPFVISLVVAAALAPALVRMLLAGGHTRVNYRARALPSPFGVLVLLAALAALVPVMLLQELAATDLLHPETVPIALYALGVLALGLIDDTLGERPDAPDDGEPGRAPARGWRGHGAAVLRGELSTGALKAVGSLGLALFATSQLGLSNGRWLLATAVLVLATNAFNLLDLRPGRAVKAFVLLGLGVGLGSGEARPLWALGLFAAPALVAGFYDVRERAMLGDTGANLLGALAGLWLVLALSGTGQVVALALLAALTVYGELRSISDVVERTPGLRQLDSFGRPA